MSTKPDEGAAAELATLAAMPDTAIDTSDIPETEDWGRAERGRFYRPVKQAVTIRRDADVVACFRRRGPRY
ncbi:MAG TPA: BrnA antitoxin family protein [Geminicoccaceae bacterium]|nr:BrnA antitoxin family protein [Geminicoccaceae bacterium]